MALSSGEKLGPYEMVALIGAGGMGQVYQARDPRLGRDVAIKVSAERFSERFEREARAVAALNHPNTCHLYDVGPNYLVMELVEGPTLADRIKQGAIPLEDALAIARQIADALEAAHEKGITHRDLKPGNIKIRPDGTVKVLDFGLAKRSGISSVQTDNSPTMTSDQTDAGVILGTAAYMSPEQAKGKSVDQRADIYAFGAVLYEMLTGKRLHDGETTTEVLASVIKEEPRWERVPEPVQLLLRRCLEKDPQKRLRHIGDVMALVNDSPRSAATVATPPATKARWVWISVAVAGLAIIAAALMVWAPWRAQPNVQAVRFEIQPTDKFTFITGGGPAVSPDGQWVVIPATGADGVTRMWLRALDSVEVRPLAGTESPTNLPPPVFWSPDSRFVAFYSGLNSAGGQLKKLAISGGPAQTICDVSGAVPGGAWSRDGVILFGTNNGPLQRVSAAGGVPTPMTVLDASRKETAHRKPQFLPDGRHFLYHRRSLNPEYTGIFVGSLDAKPEEQSLKPLLLSERQGVYAAASVTGGTGRLLFLRDTTLFAQPFDPGRLALSDEAVPIADQVGSFAPVNAGLFSISENGVLMYRIGAGGTLLQLTWFDAQGKVSGTAGERGAYANPALSPDGMHIAVTQLDLQKGSSNIWVLDTLRGTSTRLTFNAGRDDFAVWSPDAKRIAFASNRNGHLDLYEKPADGSSEERILLKSDGDKVPTGWSADGLYLLYTNVDPKTQADLWVLPMSDPSDRKPIPFLRTPFREAIGRFSPDGRFIAYQSDESGLLEIYVRPFSPDKGADSASGAKWMVSKGGGVQPHWQADGKQLFYLSQLQQMAVDVATDKTFQVGVPRRLFTTP